MIKPILAIDFDGTIHDRTRGHLKGEPLDGAKESLRLLSYDYKIIIFCVWARDEASIKSIHDWLQLYAIPHDDITNIKPNAKYFIDDKAIHFTNWKEVMTNLYQS